MGIYYGVRKVIENGKRVQSYLPLKEQPHIVEGNVLVGILDNGLWAIAVDLTDKREYQEFYNSYARGMWLSMYLYEVPEEKIKDCPDEGRVPIEELKQLLKAKSSK